jgi:hypothetical protein
VAAQDVTRCDRCGGKAMWEARSDYRRKTDTWARRLFICNTHKEQHEEAFKHQKFELVELESEKSNV